MKEPAAFVDFISYYNLSLSCKEVTGVAKTILEKGTLMRVIRTFSSSLLKEKWTSLGGITQETYGLRHDKVYHRRY